MKFRCLKTISCVLLLSLMCTYTQAQDESAEVSLDGLELVKDSKLALVYTVPGAEFSQYNRIYLEDTYVAFKKDWQKEHSKATGTVTQNDMDMIKMELSEMFREVFTDVLEDGGYELITERDEDVLLLKPAIINLDVITPVAGDGASQSYSESAGEMTLYLELYDSMSDELLAKAMDRQKDRKTGYFQWQSGVTNRAAANRILEVWANVLKNGLDEARQVGAE
jgi:hypothetical protein